MASETKYSTMCDVIKYLFDVNDVLCADFTGAEMEYGCDVGLDNEILNITYKYTKPASDKSAASEGFSVYILGWNFFIACCNYFSDDAMEGWQIPSNIEIGDTDPIQDILYDYDAEPDDNGKFSREEVESVLDICLNECIDCTPYDFVNRLENVLAGIKKESEHFYILKSEETNPKHVYVSDKVNLQLKKKSRQQKRGQKSAEPPAFVEIPAERAAQILYDNGIAFYQFE